MVEKDEVAEIATKRNVVGKGSHAWLYINFHKCPENIIKPSAQKSVQLK